MAQFGKASSQRGKPSYFMAILGVTLVLFLLGIVGWLTINSQKLMEYFKESVKVQVFLQEGIPDSSRLQVQQYIASQPYTRTWKYIDKESTIREWEQSGDEGFIEFLKNNPLPTSIDFTLKANYVDSSKLDSIKNAILTFSGIDEVKYPTAVVGNMQRNFNLMNLVLGGIAILVSILVIVLIDNTIRLAMFSNRFLIKTMQMVGATRSFISRPLLVRAVINGVVSAIISIALLYLLINTAEKLLPGMQVLRDNTLLALLFVGLILIGISISVFSTYRSVRKYLRMQLDELY